MWNEQPSQVQCAPLWIAEECYGLAIALRKIHHLTNSMQGDLNQSNSNRRPHGIHGDIKPANILWFKNLPSHLSDHEASSANKRLGFLQISDFGTVKFHSTRSLYQSSVIATTTYHAPEVAPIPHPPNLGSPKLDIWALGCVYLEVVTWYLCGRQGVEDFCSNRMGEEPDTLQFYSDKFYLEQPGIFGSRQIVKRSVSEVYTVAFHPSIFLVLFSLSVPFHLSLVANI